MTVVELIEKLQKIKNQNKEIFVAHDEADGEDILLVEEDPFACFIVYKMED